MQLLADHRSWHQHSFYDHQSKVFCISNIQNKRKLPLRTFIHFCSKGTWDLSIFHSYLHFTLSVFSKPSPLVHSQFPWIVGEFWTIQTLLEPRSKHYKGDKDKNWKGFLAQTIWSWFFWVSIRNEKYDHT